MKKITSIFFSMFITGILITHAQNISVVASGLKGPIGICNAKNGHLLVAETGTGNNDGKITLIDPVGNKYTIVFGLPSHMDTASGETSGPWRPYLISDSILIVIVGSGPDTSAGSIMEFNVESLIPGIDSLTITDTLKIYRIQAWALSHGFIDSNVFSAAWDANGNIYASDAGANAVIKIDSVGNYSILDTFPAIPNTWTPFPPFIDYVPTKIISGMNNDFYLCNLTGFPFLTGLSQIVNIDASGTVTPMTTGLSQSVDMHIDSAGNIYVLQFGLFDSTFAPVPNSASIIRIQPGGGLDTIASGFGPSSGFVPDSSDGFYATELFTGNVIHISHATSGLNNIKNNLTALTVYPNPFDESINLDYTLNESSPVTYTITDQIGNRIFYKNAGLLAKGKNTFNIDSKSLSNSNISKGIYYLTITAGKSQQTISLMKK